MPEPRRSIATVSLSGALPDKLAAVAHAGFDGVEIFDNDLIAGQLSPEQVRDLAAELGLAIDLFQPLRDIEGAPPERFADNLRRAERKFRIMRRLGADLLLVCSSVAPDTIDDDELAAAQLRALAERACVHGIRIAYEALAWGRHVHDYLHAWRLVQLADHPNLGTCLDSFHILSRDIDPVGIEAIPGAKIFYLQLADAPRLAMDVLQWSRHYRCFPGQGDFDVAGLTRHVLRTGYAGPLSLEVFNDEFRQGPGTLTAIDAMRSLRALEDQLDGIRPPTPTGFAFAELTTSDPARLGSLLATLGFAQASGIWTQGRARIVVTGGEDTALVGFGVESKDPDAALDHARALLAPEAGDTSVRTPDGTRLSFERATPATGGAEVARIDHLALIQPRHQFEAAGLFYRSVLGLDPQPSVEFADPFGLVRSRAMADDEGAVRIALNLAQIDQPSQARHVALACTDLLATARRLRAVPGILLPIPANYYDDLEARYDLPAAELGELRELGVLYDRDEHGAFLHLYTVTVGRVFFELVQRIGGYRGYGMQNSSIRLAAQHNA
ncbi:MAG TPA: TIM barrel protein [Actinospica sp.]|nr:TIM barrel protein [Actinospica sp.]